MTRDDIGAYALRMSAHSKTAQLQIRVSPSEKSAIKRAARYAGMPVSAYVLDRLLPAGSAQFQQLAAACAKETGARFALAELNSFLSALGASALQAAVASPPQTVLSAIHANYIAAMVEYASVKRDIEPPAWTSAIAPLVEPVFGSSLESLRLHVLTHSPPPFRRRNIFIDTSVGGRV